MMSIVRLDHSYPNMESRPDWEGAAFADPAKFHLLGTAGLSPQLALPNVPSSEARY